MADFSKITVGSTTYNVKDATARAAILELQESEGAAAQDSGNLAPAFSTTKSYAVGQYVIHDGVLYRCMIAHSAGAWVEAHFWQANLGDDIYVPWTTISGTARSTVSSTTAGGEAVTLDSSMTFPAGTYWAECQIIAVDSTSLTDDNKSCYLDIMESPFSEFSGLNYPQSWLKSGASFSSKNLIHIPKQITVASGTEIGYLWDVKVQSGKSCEFNIGLTFTRLSTH